MLQTKLTTLETEQEARELMSDKNVAICCGRMGPNCFPVYEHFHVLQEDYPDIAFRAMEFDTKEPTFIKGSRKNKVLELHAVLSPSIEALLQGCSRDYCPRKERRVTG